jgi:hypothetical protein
MIQKPITVWTRWMGRDGKWYEGKQHRSVSTRVRERTPAPHEYLNVINRNGRWVISSRELSLDRDSSELILHVVNLFKEIFGAHIVEAADFHHARQVSSRKLHWKIMLEGPFSDAEALAKLEEVLSYLGEHRRMIQDRIAHITVHVPDFLAVGVGGFSDYIVFGFRDRSRFVFESPNLGNATYVFRDDWRQLEQLTKTQIREGGLQLARIIHDARWESQFREALKD